MEEIIFFDRGSVKVTSSRFLVNGQTYAMSNVTSVKSGTKQAEYGGPFMIALVGLGCMLGQGWVFWLGCAILVIGFLALYSANAKYSVLLNTSSGENQALESEDKSYIINIISALNEAIISRG